MPRVVEVRHAAGADEDLASLPAAVAQACYEQLQGLAGQDLALGEHVELLAVEGVAVRVNLFLDVDGTLWIERLAGSA